MMKLNYFKSVLLLFFVFCFVHSRAQVSGTVYLDGNNNGVKDTKEVGYPYLTVKAYTTGNTQVASAVTSVTGTYTLTGLTSGTKYRIEFESPSGYFNGAYGTGSSTSVQFITANASNVNYGLFVPAKCGTDPNPRLIGTNAMIASGSLTKSVISWRYQTDFYAQDHWGGVPIANGTVHPHSEDILGTQVGVPWAMSRIVNTKLIAMVPMASPESIFGTGGASGIDAIYMSDYSGASNAYTSSKTLVDFGTLGISVTATHPIGAIQPRFGEYGFGGIVNSSDGKYLYVSNLGKGNIARIDISGVDYTQLPVTAPTLANVTEINLPTTFAGFTSGTQGYFRATSMIRHAGEIYVAGTFDGSLLSNNTAVRIVILKLNQTNNTFSEVFSYDPTAFLVGNFNYADVPQTRWTAGPDVSTSSSTHGPLQPIVNGFDFDDYGAIVLGVGDRAVYNLNTSNQTGYVISAWPNGSGGFTLENAGARGPLTTFMSGSTFHNIYGAGPGGDLFFDQAQGHPFLYSGGILNLPGKNSLAMGITDPIGIAAFGVRYDRPSDGRVIGGIHLGGAKQFALVGVENVCDLDPIEVGNLVWEDTNDNGIQDGGEPAIAGVTVELVDNANTVIATATTDSKGYYIFSSDPNRTSTANFIYNITALTTKSNFKVRIPNVSGGSQQSAFAGLFVTLKDADRDVIDNDAITVGVNAEIAFTTGTEGENKHDYDFGFSNVQSCVKPNAGVDLTACAGTCMDITGTLPTSGTWSAQVGNPSGATIGTTTSGVANVCFNSTASGTYNFIYNIGTGCEDTMSIVVSLPTSNTTNATACNSYTWSVNNQTYTSSGTYTSTSTNAAGCVHTETLNLTINSSTSNTTNATACDTYTWSVNNQTYTTSGTYTSTSTNAAGCVHTETLNLTINSSTSNTTNATACDTYTWSVNNQTYTSSGTYTSTSTNAAGCVHTETLNLTINSSTSNTTNATACNTYTWSVNNQTYTSSGTYTSTSTNAAGCVHTEILNLTINNSTSNTTNATACNTYTWSVNNQTYTSSGTYTATSTNAAGCVHTEILNLTINNSTSNTTNATACNTYTWSVNNQTYTSSGTYTATSTNAAGCVHTEILNLTINNSTSNTTNATACNTYTWSVNNQTYTSSGTYTATSTNAAGCVHTEILNLTINTPSNSITNVSACPSSLPYNWNGTGYSTAGTYTFNATNAAGCDSVATLVLSISATSTSTTNITVCTALLPYSWNGTGYSSAGTYTYQTTGVTGCDSIATLNLSIADGSVGNYVWSDANNNGANDEPTTAGINGVIVELWNATTNTFVATTTTSNDGSSNPGYYNFVVCTSGDYKVKFPTSNSGNSLTTQTTTSATDNNSDANVSTGESPVFTIDVNGTGTAKDNNTIDAGYATPIAIIPACLGNYVFNDINQNGIQDGLEVGVAGVTTTLYNAVTNAILATVTTDAYGYYQFCGLNPGDYKVGFSLPSNYVFTSSNIGGNDEVDSDPSNITGLTATVTLVSGDSNMTIDAGIYQPQPTTATVGDKVWFDTDSDGIQDPNENGVSGVTVTLYNCANPTTPIATTITGANGNYIFENVAPGNYSVSFTAPTGTTFTIPTGTVNTTDNSDVDATGKTACFPVVAGDKITYVDAGIIPQTPTNASLGDKVWNDVNQDGIQDPTETGVAGVTVTLYDATGTTVIKTMTTDGLGNYGFNDLTPGCYVVGFSLPAGYTRSTQNEGTDTTKNSDANASTGMTNQICVTAGQNNPTIDAGIYNSANTNSIGDKVWYDVNHDGLQDPTEYGYPGVVVTLYDCTTNTIIATTTTNANGNYLFDGIANGDYYVGFGFIPGYQFTGANSDATGIAGANNSDANPSTGLTTCVSLTGNTHITTVDAGIYPGGNRTATSSLGDIVWTDANNNGIQDNGETGVSGVTVNLYNCSDLVTPIATTISDGLGNYIFTNLLGGNYAVGFSNLPAGYTFTTQGSNIEDEDNSDANTATGQTACIPLGLGEDKMSVDAGIVAPANTVCLGDYVWIDLNNNGTQDANEPAVPGVTVKLYDNNTNTVLQVATTNAEGNYLFCGLTNGNTYSVGFENLPAGFTFTTQTGTLSTPDNSDANPATGRTTTVTMGASNDLSLDAGIYSSTTAVVGNYVWYDEDADGLQDATEAPISGVLVTLYNNTNTAVASAVTDANGGYLFTNVTPGTYTIGFEGYPSSLIPTTKGTTNPATADDDSNIDPITGRTDAFTVTPGSSNLTLDAGYKANPIAGLGNYVWYDVNEDGLQGANEPSLSGVVVTLYAADGTTALANAITDGNGAYSFPNLTAGDYKVGFSNLPIGFTRTQSVGTLNDALNSDIGISNKTATVTLLAGTYNPNIDAGFYFGVPLPVTLTQFDVHANQCGVDVKWQTSTEQNLAYFNVMRKTTKDADFVSIGEVSAVGNSQSVNVYSFHDQVAAGVYQYKLKMVDVDGRAKESLIQVAVVNCAPMDEVSIYPNPASTQLFVRFNNETSVNYTLNLRDITGSLLKQTQLTTQGERQIELEITDFSNGLYTLEVISDDEKKIFKLQLSK